MVRTVCVFTSQYRGARVDGQAEAQEDTDNINLPVGEYLDLFSIGNLAWVFSISPARVHSCRTPHLAKNILACKALSILPLTYIYKKKHVKHATRLLVPPAGTQSGANTNIDR